MGSASGKNFTLAPGSLSGGGLFDLIGYALAFDFLGFKWGLSRLPLFGECSSIGVNVEQDLSLVP